MGTKLFTCLGTLLLAQTAAGQIKYTSLPYGPTLTTPASPYIQLSFSSSLAPLNTEEFQKGFARLIQKEKLPVLPTAPTHVSISIQAASTKFLISIHSTSGLYRQATCTGSEMLSVLEEGIAELKSTLPEASVLRDPDVSGITFSQGIGDARIYLDSNVAKEIETVYFALDPFTLVLKNNSTNAHNVAYSLDGTTTKNVELLPHASTTISHNEPLLLPFVSLRYSPQ